MADRSATRLSDWPAGPHPSCNGRFVVSRRRYSLPLSLLLSLSLSHPPSPSTSLSLPYTRLYASATKLQQPRESRLDYGTYLPTCLPLSLESLFTLLFPFLAIFLYLSRSLALLLRSPNRCIFLALTFPPTFLFHLCSLISRLRFLCRADHYRPIVSRVISKYTRY